MNSGNGGLMLMRKSTGNGTDMSMKILFNFGEYLRKKLKNTVIPNNLLNCTETYDPWIFHAVRVNRDLEIVRPRILFVRENVEGRFDVLH